MIKMNDFFKNKMTRIFAIAAIALFTANTVFAQTTITVDMSTLTSASPNTTFYPATTSGVGCYPGSTLTYDVPNTPNINYIFTGTAIDKTIRIASGYQGIITLKNLNLTSNNSIYNHGAATPAYTSLTTNDYLSCITVVGQYNCSNLTPVTKVDFILEGNNVLNYTNQNYCALQVQQGAQININAININDNNSGKLDAQCTAPVSGVQGQAGGAAAIGAKTYNYTSTQFGSNVCEGYWDNPNTTCESEFGGGTNPTPGRMRTAGGNIFIGSGTIYARGGHGAGIGGGYRTYYDGLIIIYGGVVDAGTAAHGAGIGSGCPKGSGVLTNGCYTPNSAIIALPPSTITAFGASMYAGLTSPDYNLALAGSAFIAYVNDPQKPLITVQTQYKEPEAPIYLDLTTYPGLKQRFDVVYPDFLLNMVGIGKTNATTGTISFHGLFEGPTTFFTTTLSTPLALTPGTPTPYGRPHLSNTPNQVVAPGGTTIVLNLLPSCIIYEDIWSVPLMVGYSIGEALNNAYRLRITNCEPSTAITNMTFAIQNERYFNTNTLKFYQGDCVTPIIPPPTSIAPNSSICIAIPIDQNKPLGLYSDVLKIGGVHGIPIPDHLRRIGRQRVADHDATNEYLCVSAHLGTFNSPITPSSNTETLTLLINHHNGMNAPYDEFAVRAQYIVSPYPDYATTVQNYPLHTWNELHISPTNNTPINTTVTFNTLPDGVYYIHWYVESGTAYSHSEDVPAPPTPLRNCGGFGPYTLGVPSLPGTIGAASTTICSGSTVALTNVTAATGSGSPTYTWMYSTTSNTGPWTAFSTSTNTATFTTPALTQPTYYIVRRATFGANNVYSNVITVTVTPSITSAGSIAADQTICSGETPAAFTSTGVATGGTGTYNYQWQSSPDGSTWTDISGSTLSTYAPGPLTTTTHFRRNVTSGACSASTTPVIITVNPLPSAITITPGNNSRCGSGTVVLSVTPTNPGANLSYRWYTVSNGGTSVGTSASYTTPNISTTTDYYVALYNTSTGCESSATRTKVMATVNPNPTASVTGASSICLGGTTTLSPTTGGTWSSSDITVATVNNSGQVTASATKTGSVTFTFTQTGTLCTAQTTPVVVNSCLTPCNATLSSGSGTNNRTVCVGSPMATITYSTTGVAAQTDISVTGLPTGVSASWSSSGGGTLTISGTPSIDGNFPYDIVFTGGCTANVMNAGTITVTPRSTAANILTRDTSLCGTGTVNLNDLILGITGITGTPTYSWYANATDASPITGTAVTAASITTTKSYWVAVSTSSHCEGTANASGRKEVKITVYPAVTASITTSFNCNPWPATTGILTVTAPTSDYTYSLNGLGFQTSNIFSGVPTGNAHTITIKDGNNCTKTQASIPVNCTCTATPAEVTLATDTSTTCGNTPTQNTVTFKGGVSQVNVSLMPGYGGSVSPQLITTSGTTISYQYGNTPTIPQTIKIQAIAVPSSISCKPDTTYWKITVLPDFFAGYIKAGTKTICSGDNTTITIDNDAPAAGGLAGTINYEWYKDGNPISGSNTSSYTIPNGDKVNTGTTDLVIVYTRKAYDDFCQKVPVSSPQTYTLTVRPLPSVTNNDFSICNGTNTNITLASSPTGATYTWEVISNTNCGSTPAVGTIGTTSTINHTLTLTGGQTSGSVVYRVTPILNTCAGAYKDITVTVNCPYTTVRGTVFPFVNRGEGDASATGFNSQFPITVKLKAVPTFASKPTEAQLAAFFNGTELYSTTAIPYTGAKFVPNTPEHPGALGEFTNYGEIINFGPIGKTHVPGSPRILLNNEAPFTIEGNTVGFYEFANVAPGDYILEISRAGYMVRWAKITVNNTDAVQNLKHREIIPGYVITDDAPTYLKIFTNDAAELARLIEQGIYYKGMGYDPKYDLNADGYIDAYDYYLLKKYINFMHEHYEDTWSWIDGY